MRIAYGEGVIVLILVPVVLYLLGLTDISRTLFLIFLLFGLWTIIAAFVFGNKGERMFYLGWGLVMVGVSTGFVLPISYAVAIVLIAVIAVILLTVATRKPSTRAVESVKE